MLDSVAVRRHDRSRMVDRVASLPDQLEESFLAAGSLRIGAADVRRAFLVGMGGSAIAGDIFTSWAGSRSAIEMRVVRDYVLPGSPDPADVLIALSYSGNTEETLSAVEHARRIGMGVTVVTSGGALGRVAADRGYPLVKVPPGMVPRAAFGHLFGALPAVCGAWILGDVDREVGEACAHLRSAAERWGPETPRDDNRAKDLAFGIGSRTPIVYAARPYGPVAMRWQTQFNENAKALAWASSFPEADHNEIVGWASDAAARGFVPIFLRDPEETPEMRRRIDATRDLLPGANVVEVSDAGATILSRMLGTVLLGDFASVYLACLRGHDPAEAPILDQLKAALAARPRTRGMG